MPLTEFCFYPARGVLVRFENRWKCAGRKDLLPNSELENCPYLVELSTIVQIGCEIDDVIQ